MIATVIALAVGLLIGLARAAVYIVGTGRHYRREIIDLQMALLDKGVQVRHLTEQIDALGVAVNQNAEIVMGQDARINRLLDALRIQNNQAAELARLLRIAQQQTRNRPTTDFIFPN